MSLLYNFFKTKLIKIPVRLKVSWGLFLFGVVFLVVCNNRIYFHFIGFRFRFAKIYLNPYQSWR